MLSKCFVLTGTAAGSILYKLFILIFHMSEAGMRHEGPSSVEVEAGEVLNGKRLSGYVSRGENEPDRKVEIFVESVLHEDSGDDSGVPMFDIVIRDPELQEETRLQQLGLDGFDNDTSFDRDETKAFLELLVKELRGELRAGLITDSLREIDRRVNPEGAEKQRKADEQASWRKYGGRKPGALEMMAEAEAAVTLEEGAVDPATGLPRGVSKNNIVAGSREKDILDEERRERMDREANEV